jgi:hypothetical protein
MLGLLSPRRSIQDKVLMFESIRALTYSAYKDWNIQVSQPKAKNASIE